MDRSLRVRAQTQLALLSDHLMLMKEPTVRLTNHELRLPTTDMVVFGPRSKPLTSRAAPRSKDPPPLNSACTHS